MRAWEPDGNTRELSYDPEGNVTRVRDLQKDVRFSYQGMGRLASRSEGGTTVRFTYDTEERLTGIVNEHGLVYRFDLGPTGQVDTEHGFDGVRRRYIRDQAGRAVKVLRPADRESAYTYDAAGRVTSVEHDGERETFAYRPDGVLIEVSNATATVKLERDVLGRIVRESTGDDWVSSEYDVLGFRARVRSSRGFDQNIHRDAGG